MHSTDDIADVKHRDYAPVSVIIPCYNCALTIERALESVWNQTHRPAEVLLVNDASNDETALLLDGLTRRFNSWLTVIHLETNSGPATARNTAWKYASQPYIAFLDADDSWHPRKIELQYAWMESHPAIRLTAHGYRVHVNISDTPPVQNDVLQAVLVSFKRLLLSNLFSTPTVMLHSDISFRFATGKRYAEDYLLWLSIAANYECCFFAAKLTNLYKSEYGVSGLSAALWDMEKGELDTYAKTYRQGYIPLLMLMPLCLLSLFKFVIRLICKLLKGVII